MSEQIQFEIGDRVWSFRYKDWGKIVDIDDPDNYPIKVEFERESTEWCEVDDIYFEEIVIPESARVRPIPKHEFKPGQPVCVKLKASRNWHIRAFVKERGDGTFICTAGGGTGRNAVWPQCVPYDRTLLGFGAVGEEGDNG